MGVIDAVGGIVGQHMANKANMKLAEYSYSKDLDMWNRQNAYNSPEAQMQRFQAAGLNPNLVYSQGSGATSGNASQMPKYNAPTMQNNWSPTNLPPLLSMYQDMKLRQAQTNNTEAQTQNVNAQTVLNLIKGKSEEAQLGILNAFGMESARTELALKKMGVTGAQWDNANREEQYHILKATGMSEAKARNELLRLETKDAVRKDIAGEKSNPYVLEIEKTQADIAALKTRNMLTQEMIQSEKLRHELANIEVKDKDYDYQYKSFLTPRGRHAREGIQSMLGWRSKVFDYIKSFGK